VYFALDKGMWCYRLVRQQGIFLFTNIWGNMSPPLISSGSLLIKHGAAPLDESIAGIGKHELSSVAGKLAREMKRVTDWPCEGNNARSFVDKIDSMYSLRHRKISG
jgi:hypothetical protein